MTLISSEQPGMSAGVRRLAATWEQRGVFKQPLPDLDKDYKTGIPDFPLDRVPFKDCPAFAGTSEEPLHRLLAAAWIWYNEKTIGIEEDIVNPACKLVRDGVFAGARSELVKDAMSQTMVDEQYHVHMCLSACISARRRHRLEALVLPAPHVVRAVRSAVAAAASEHDGHLAQLAFMTVAELTINAYLLILSSDKTIQPGNRLLTDMHRKDEAAHATIIRTMLKTLFVSLSSADQNRFLGFVQTAIAAFVKQEFEPWEASLRFLDFADVDALIEFASRTHGHKPAFRDYGSLRLFLAELGIAERITLP